MRRFGKFWIDENGDYHKYPTRDLAVEHGVKLYKSDTPCKNCGGNLHYTANDRCKSCAMDVSIIFNNVVNHNGDVNQWVKLDPATGEYLHNARYGKWQVMSPELFAELLESIKIYNDSEQPIRTRIEPCNSGHVGMLYGKSSCVMCSTKRSPRQVAIAAGEKTYIPNKNCPVCHQRAPRRVDNSRCLGCFPHTDGNSPRQAAIAAGEAWYTPTTPCKYCGEIAPKRVSNGSCRSCEEKRKKVVGAKRQSPRQAAIAAGEAWYMPTTPCKMCGEIAPKRVNNGSCRSCEEKRKQCGNPQ